jgi:hypothetical protein
MSYPRWWLESTSHRASFHTRTRNAFDKRIAMLKQEYAELWPIDDAEYSFVYVLQDCSGLYKIGRSVNVERRMTEIASSGDLRKILILRAFSPSKLEALIHHEFRDYQHSHYPENAIEWYALRFVDLQYIHDTFSEMVEYWYYSDESAMNEIKAWQRLYSGS